MTSAGVKRVDRSAVTAAVEEWATAISQRPEVVRLVWYGSFIQGIPTPRSDVDVCIVVRANLPATIPRHARSADYLPAWGTPAPFDLAVLTTDEYADLASWAPNWAAAIRDGRVLFAR